MGILLRKKIPLELDQAPSDYFCSRPKEQKKTLISFCKKLKDTRKPRRLNVYKILYALRKTNLEDTTRDTINDQAWELVENGTTACGDRALVYLRRLETLAKIHGTADLKTVANVILGQSRLDTLEDLISKEFPTYSENIEIFLYASLKLAKDPELPVEQDQMRHKSYALQAFVGKAESLPKALKRWKTTILERTDTPEKRVEWLVQCPLWVNRIKEMNEEAFKSQERLARNEMEELDVSYLSEGEKLRQYALLQKKFEAQDLVRTITRKFTT